MIAYYQPKVNELKERFKEFEENLSDKLSGMSKEEKNRFFEGMSPEKVSVFTSLMNQDSSLDHGHDRAYMEHMDMMQEEMFRQHEQWAMNETIRGVTSFDEGGYVQGAGFNMSDTFAQESMDFSSSNDFGSSMDFGSSFHDNF